MNKRFKFDNANETRIYPRKRNQWNSLRLIETRICKSRTEEQNVCESIKRIELANYLILMFAWKHWVKMEKSERIKKYLYLATVLKWSWNMRVTVIPIVVGGLRTVPKYLKRDRRNLKTERESRPTISQNC